MKIEMIIVVFFLFISSSWGQQLENAVEALETTSKAVKNAGEIDHPCINCQVDLTDKKYLLDKKEIVIDNPVFYTQRPYTINLVRNANSPSVVHLKFQVGHRVCKKMTAYENRYSKSMVLDCLYYTTQMEEQDIELDLKSLPKTENEIYELKFSKDSSDSSKYNLEVNTLKGPNLKIKKDNKFFGRGINLKFTKDEA